MPEIENPRRELKVFISFAFLIPGTQKILKEIKQKSSSLENQKLYLDYNGLMDSI